jgi:tRNA(Ile)-lysidine synthase
VEAAVEAAEAAAVAAAASALGYAHAVLAWTGPKPSTGVQAAARAARYRLMGEHMAGRGIVSLFTAHTRDDQAETLLMRMLRGSGIAGLAAMARETEREGLWLARPLLDIPKSRLVATLGRAKIAFADDPTNRDSNFTRPRLRALMPALAEEGGDSRNLARLASRLARANAAIEVLADGAERYLALRDRDDAAWFGFDALAFAGLPEEIRIRLLKRSIDRAGHEGPAELGKVETLTAALDTAIAGGGKQTRLKQTLAGAAISLDGGRIFVDPAPPRRGRRT